MVKKARIRVEGGPEMIPIRVTEAEYERLKERAKKAGLSVNRYLIECALGVRFKPDAKERELYERADFELRKGVYKLSQMYMTDGMPIEKEKLEKALNELTEAREMLKKCYGEGRWWEKSGEVDEGAALEVTEGMDEGISER